jgi:uncharacterized protein (TIGR02145 family)
LYNWYTVNTRKLCPAGWHVPTSKEWTTLETYLITNGFNCGGRTTSQENAKSLASISEWTSSTNIGAVGNIDYPATRNASGFTALPGGCRYLNGTFSWIGINGSWWEATELDSGRALYFYLNCDESNVERKFNRKEFGFSVRCLRN